MSVKPGDIDHSIKVGDIEAVINRGRDFTKRWMETNDPDWMDRALLAWIMVPQAI